MNERRPQNGFEARVASAAGRPGSEALLSACLDRIASREADIQAWSHLEPDAVLEAACQLDASAGDGPLRGLPVAVKDIFDTRTMPTTYGSPIYAGHMPAADASVVSLIRRAGGLVMGKTVTTEFAFFEPGRTANPHDPTRTPGGSSSGSAAAVADGMVPFALGTQTAGSIIRPASYCGVVGYKPTHGLICPVGMKTAAWSLDTIGVFARSVTDAALLAEVLCGHALIDASESPRSPHFGLCRTPQWAAATADTRNALAQAQHCIEAGGGRVTEIELPSLFDGLLAAQHCIMTYEAARSLAFEHEVYPQQLSARLKDLLDQGLRTPAAEYADAQSLARRCRAELAQVFAGVDVLLVPSAPGIAPLRVDGTGDPVFNRIWTLLGTPCLNVPGLGGAHGMPVGIQLVAPRHEDRVALAAGEWLFGQFQPPGFGWP